MVCNGDCEYSKFICAVKLRRNQTEGYKRMKDIINDVEGMPMADISGRMNGANEALEHSQGIMESLEDMSVDELQTVVSKCNDVIKFREAVAEQHTP